MTTRKMLSTLASGLAVVLGLLLGAAVSRADPPLERFSASVVDAETGFPIVGASVTWKISYFDQNGDLIETDRPQANTDAKGNALAFIPVPVGAMGLAWSATASAPGYFPNGAGTQGPVWNPGGNPVSYSGYITLQQQP